MGVVLYQANIISDTNQLDPNKSYCHAVIDGKSHEVTCRAAYISTVITIVAAIANVTVGMQWVYR